MVVVDTNGSAPAWFAANETWSAGCQSLVAILVANGSLRSELTTGAMARPSGTAREPFCCRGPEGQRKIHVNIRMYLRGILGRFFSSGRGEGRAHGRGGGDTTACTLQVRNVVEIIVRA